jgi:hypothetical protein
MGGVRKLHAAFLNEGRTRGGVQSSEVGNPGSAPQDMFAPAMAMHIRRKHLTPKNRSGEYERSVFNLEAVTAKKCDGEGKSVVKDYVSTGRTYTTRTRQYGARERKRISG